MASHAFIRALVAFGYTLMSNGLSSPHIRLVSAFLQKLCLRDVLGQLDVNCVIDVGANQGQYATSLRRLGYEGHIISVEPNQDAFVSLQKSIEKDPLWRGFQLALGKENARKALNVTRSSRLSSFRVPTGFELLASDGLEVIRVDQVEVRRLDSVLPSFLDGIKTPRIFLKMDTQGYDLEVVEGAEGCIDRVLGIQAELSVYPLYDDMPTYIEALQVYRSLGFDLVDLFPIAYDKYGNPIEHDCILARWDRTTT